MDRGAWRATVHGVTRVRHILATKPLKYLREEFGFIFSECETTERPATPYAVWIALSHHTPHSHGVVSSVDPESRPLGCNYMDYFSLSQCLQTVGAARLWWRLRASWPGPERGDFPGPTRAGGQGGWEGFSGDLRGRSRIPHASQGECWCLASWAQSWSDSTKWDSVCQAHTLALCLVWTRQLRAGFCEFRVLLTHTAEHPTEGYSRSVWGFATETVPR